MEYSGTWKEIWTQKGLMQGTKDDIRIYDGWEKSTTDMRHIAGRIKECLGITKDTKVLEAGCGAGGLTQYMDADYVGIDFSRPLTERCMEFFYKPAICCEANDLPFKDGYFDVSFSWGVFLYFTSHAYMKEVVAEMKRVTRTAIFIGDIPQVSHNRRHMTYTKEQFVRMGFEVTKGWAEPYVKERFNAVWRKKQ